MSKQIEALKMAIKALQNISKSLTEKQVWFSSDVYDSINACKEALEQPTGNSAKLPVAWQWLTSGHMRQKIPKTATPEHWRPLYTHPKEWNGLTAEEINSIPLNENTVQTVENLLRSKNLCI